MRALLSNPQMAGRILNMINKDEAEKYDLEQAIANAKDAITEAYEKAISDAVTKLEAVDKANSDALAKAIENLEKLIDAAEDTAIAGDHTLSDMITEAITKAENELNAAKESMEVPVEQISNFCPGLDIASITHEFLPTRLYMS